MPGVRLRLDMDEHLCNARVGLEDSVLHGMRNSMTLPYRQVAIDNDVQIDEEFKSHLPHEAFFQIDDTGNQLGYCLDLVLNRLGRSHIAELGQRRPDLPN